jgi:hypothetical protein
MRNGAVWSGAFKEEGHYCASDVIVDAMAQ